MSPDTDPTTPHGNPPAVPPVARDVATAGKGMPPKAPREDRERTGDAASLTDKAVEMSHANPNERDQSVAMTAPNPDPKIQQALADVQSGKQDTSEALVTNEVYKKQKEAGA
jgi:hypothetical protein